MFSCKSSQHIRTTLTSAFEIVVLYLIVFISVSRYLPIAVELNCRQVFSIVFSFSDVRAIKTLVEQFLCLFPQNAQQSKGLGRQEAVVCTAYRLCNLNLWHWLGIGNRYCKYKGKHRYTEMILLLLLTSFFPLLLFAMNHKLRTSVVLYFSAARRSSNQYRNVYCVQQNLL